MNHNSLTLVGFWGYLCMRGVGWVVQVLEWKFSFLDLDGSWDELNGGTNSQNPIPKFSLPLLMSPKPSNFQTLCPLWQGRPWVTDVHLSWARYDYFLTESSCSEILTSLHTGLTRIFFLCSFEWLWKHTTYLTIICSQRAAARWDNSP